MKRTFYRPSILIFLAFTMALLFLVAPKAAAAAPASVGPTVHRVQTGETLNTIAARYGTTINDLMALNRLRNPNLIYVGQRLVVSPATAEEAPSSGANVHVVRRGQTLTSIAAQYGVTSAALKQANNLRTDTIFVGQRLKIPTGGGSSAPTGTTHTVKRGETLASIAAAYGTTVDALAKLNGLSNTGLIQVGQKLIVSAEGGGAQSVPRGAKKIVVDISEQRCWRYQGEELLNTWRCSTARKGYGTRTGTFRVQSKLRKAYGSTWDIWMPYWLGIYWSGSTENGFHGLPWNATTGARTWAGLVGTPITYGCVMLNDAPMKTLWNWADIGTKVVIKS
ncbi:MAG: LysM peptidoglycan-binding domain-containing protein [Caldilineales bacterium]|nr:LysM peptidoglycan-binding domain-containing protein [Caldilineales bacterium]